jgi:hypothetical protein
VAKLESYDNKDAVPAVLRDYYVEKDGKWIPDAPELYQGGLNALEGERQQRAAAVKRAEAAEAKVKAAEDKLKAAETAAAAAAAASATEAGGAATDTAKEFERLKREYDERLKAVEQKAAEDEKRRVAAEERLRETSLSDTLRAAILEAGVPKGAVEDLVTHPRFRAPWKQTEGGEFAPFEGDMPRLDPDAPAKTMSARAYVKEYLKENPHWLPGSNGSGAQGAGPGRRGGVVTVSRDELRDAASYQRITSEAEKSGAVIQVTD